MSMWIYLYSLKFLNVPNINVDIPIFIQLFKSYECQCRYTYVWILKGGQSPWDRAPYLLKFLNLMNVNVDIFCLKVNAPWTL